MGAGGFRRRAESQAGYYRKNHGVNTMSDSNIKNVAMIGAGTLGGQIAWHSAYMGKQVTVYDVSEEGLEKCQAAQAGYAAIYSTDLNASDADIEATRSRLTFTTDLVEAAQDVDLVIEAVPEGARHQNRCL
jgi:3-hydroxybutyryl-CoA dehydrogenase